MTTLDVYESDNTTFVATLATTDAEGWQRGLLKAGGKEKLNEDGDVTFLIAADHPHADELTAGRFVRLVDGDVSVVGVLNDELMRVVVADDDKKLIEVKARGPLSEWESSPVDPWLLTRPNSPDRVWNWASPTLDLTGWSTSVVEVARPSTRPRLPEAWPVAPDFNAWIWSRALVSGEAPAGDSLFRIEFELVDPTELALYIAADNTWDLWLDGVLLEREAVRPPDVSGFMRTRHYVLEVAAGVHHVAIKGTNWGQGAENPAGLIFAAFESNDGVLGDVIVTSADDVGMPWVCLDYPSAFPGFTAVEIIEQLLLEAQTRFELPGWSVVGHGTFPEIIEVSCRVGDSSRDVLDTLTATHCDIVADTAGKVLHVYPKSVGVGTTTAVEYVQGVNLRYLSETWSHDFVNAVQVTWAKGVEWFADLAAITAAGVRRSKSVQFPNMDDLDAVEQVADQLLAMYSTPTRSIVAQVVGTAGAVPGVDFGVGDVVTVDGDPVRCVGLTWTLGPDGRLEATPEFDTQLSIRAQDRQRAIDRLAARFDAPASAALLGSDTMITSGQVESERVTWSWPGDIEESLSDTDPDKLWQPYRPDRALRISRFEVEINVEDLPDASGDTQIQLFKNGVLLNGLYDLTLDTTTERHYVDIWAYEVIGPGDRVSPKCVAAGGHVDGSIVMVLADTV